MHGRRGVLLLLALVVAASPFSMTGCWDLQELEDITTASLVGIDKGPEDGWVRVTVLLQEPAEGGGPAGGGGTVGQAGLRYVTITGEGPTFSLAVQRLNRVTNRL
ncbi:MAG: hypothetical protein K6U08_04165, partial [Firmicutes bacterium]|nr:hypothetical protein [Bacillota bacterium]